MLKIKKYVLFSPVGTHDPVGVVDKDGKPSEGSMLHIIRHYKPEVIYLYITKELNYNDNRYEKAIKKFNPAREVVEIISELDKDDVNNYDAFMSDFRKYITEIHDKYNNKGYEILLNIASGTPQMKSNLILEVITNNIKLIPVQVDTPTKKRNFEDTFLFDDLDKIDTDKENIKNRCKEPEILSFKRAKIQSQIESLIKSYEYSAAYNLFSKVENISELFEDNLLKYLEHANLRVNLKYNEANKIINLANKDLADIENELLEYYYVMKLKYKKGELSDFILRISPFATDLLFYYLKQNVPALNKVLRDSKNGKQICINESSDINLINIYNNLYNKNKNYKKDDSFISLARLLTIKDYYKKEKNNGINVNIVKLFDEIRDIEKNVRNNVAHRMINITEEFINKKVGLSSKIILRKNEELIKKVIPKIDTNYFLYDSLNQKIIYLLRKNKL
ncbi:hypothetical protein [uncultured Brachyspira sp.]|uniref:type III-A CRISPR-associated CARF protein Csm6 n=1 Tax=uncultured Brachyspira sp. TaxID=221953 RepID=UPI002587256C|nr:hypothetical protein [uncultured Brachyspira sp.]